MTPPEIHPQKRRGDLLALAFGLLLAALGIAAAEWTSAALLRARGQTAYPLFYQSPTNLTVRQGEWGPLVLSFLDPLLGYAANPARNPLMQELPGFVRYGPADAPLTIVALGGSTTDAYAAVVLGDPNADPQDPYNWPRELQRLLATEGIEVQVLNGGTLGYSSSQDLFKLIRDVIPLKPDVVIALEGVNDLSYKLNVPEHPHVTQYQRQTLETWLARDQTSRVLPNLFALAKAALPPQVRAVDGYSLGLPETITPAQHWRRNMVTANAICAAQGIAYCGLLQPVLGFGAYQPTQEESALLEERCRVYQAAGEDYLAALQRDYSEARQACGEVPACSDLTGIFDQASGVYLDTTHQNRSGVERLAREVLQVLRLRGLVPGGSGPS